MGRTGPPPKRESQRRRQNKRPAVTKGRAGDPRTKAELLEVARAHGVEVQASWRKDQIAEAIEAAVPGADLRSPDPGWHPVAAAWFEALARSGQSVFYEASDWATARLLAESMSRDLSPQPVVVGKGADATVEMHALPVKGASLSAYRSHMAALLVTEGDRRRAEVELEKPKPDPEGVEGGGSVSWLDDARARLHGTG